MPTPSSIDSLAEPMSLNFCDGESLRAALDDLLTEASRQKYPETRLSRRTEIMRYLVEAWLRMNQVRTGTTYQPLYRDASSDEGDFRVGKTILFVTSSPDFNLIHRCLASGGKGMLPVVISNRAGAAQTEDLANQIGVSYSIEAIDFVQFMVTNLLHLSGGELTQRGFFADEWIRHYNAIIDDNRISPNLRIEVT